MMILDGKAIAAKRLEDLKDKIQALETKPKLVAVIVGEDPGSQMYVNMKSKRATEVGMVSETLELLAMISDKDLIYQIKKLNEEKSVTGILIQLPFPEGSPAEKNQREILDTINPVKDVDCLTSANMGLLAVGKPRYYPATVRGILTLLEQVLQVEASSKQVFAGKHATVIGRSEIVGKPMAMALINLGATVTVCNSRTSDLTEVVRQADIIISAAGEPGLIKADMVKKGVVVIDAGISKIRNSKLEIRNSVVGDVIFEAVKDVASAITPVPGGVGPMTIVSLLENTVEAAYNS